MAYSEKLAARIRQSLSGIRKVQEKKMFGGIAFLVNDKMCVGVDKDNLMVRCDPEMTDEFLRRKGVRIFDMTGKPMKGWLLVGPEATSGKRNLDRWIGIALEANRRAALSRKKKGQ